MEKAAKRNLTVITKSYLLLMKPGIIMGNLITMAGGFFFAAGKNYNLIQFLFVTLGLAMIIASAAIWNNYIDKEIDRKMERTKNRAFAQGLISSTQAFLLLFFLLFSGATLLAFYATKAALFVAMFGFVVYIFVYSIAKRISPFGTLIGSLAGAVPPVVGYCSVTGSWDRCATLLFLLLVFWQIPHFLAIATFRLEEYKAADLPILPLVRGMIWTKIQMSFYIFLFGITAFLLWQYQYVNQTFLVLSSLLTLVWFFFSCKGFTLSEDKKWGRQMFFLSLIVIVSLFTLLPFTAL